MQGGVFFKVGIINIEATTISRGRKDYLPRKLREVRTIRTNKGVKWLDINPAF